MAYDRLFIKLNLCKKSVIFLFPFLLQDHVCYCGNVRLEPCKCLQGPTCINKFAFDIPMSGFNSL